jgi:hypothetical protein
MKVRILIRAGVVEHGKAEIATRFVATVGPGEVGEYIGIHPTLRDWHIIRHSSGDVPLHESQFEKAS